MKSYFPPVHQVAALLIAAVTALTLGLRTAEASPCKGAGAPCPTNNSCCSRVCVGATSGGRNHVFGVCAAANGGPCTNDSQCISTHCVDSVCCDTACDGTCEACSAAKTGGIDGTCTFIPADSDPDGECPAGQCVTGSCDGAGACGNLAPGTHCDAGVDCSATDQCNGAGTCVHTGNGCPLNMPHCESGDTCTSE